MEGACADVQSHAVVCPFPVNLLDPSSVPGDQLPSREERVWVGVLTSCLFGTALLIGPAGLEEGEAFGLPKLLVLLVSAGVLAFLMLRQPPRWGPGVVRIGACSIIALSVSLLCVVHSDFSQRLGLERLGLEAAGGVVFLAAAALGDRVDARERLHSMLLLAACLIAGVALVEALGLVLPWGELRRPVSLLGNRNVVAGYLGMMLPLALQRCARAEHPWRQGGVVFLLVIVVMLCRTRSVWLGLAVAGALQGALLLVRACREGRPPGAWRSATRCLAPLLLGALVASMVSWPGLKWRESNPMMSSASRLLEYEKGSGRYRVAQHRVGLAILTKTPWLGVGPHGWTQASGQYAHTVPGVHATPFGDGAAPRSDLLRTVTETGLLGLAPRLLSVLLLLVLLTRQVLVDPTSGALASLVVLAIQGLFDTPMLRSEQLAAGAVLLGLGAGAAAPGAPQPLAWGRWWLAIPGLLVTLGVGLVGSYAAQVFLMPEVVTPALLASDRPKALLTVAARLEREGGCGAAEPLLARALEVAPYSLGALCFAARCADQLGQTTRAQALIRRAFLIEPHLPSLAARVPDHDCARLPSVEGLGHLLIPM